MEGPALTEPADMFMDLVRRTPEIVEIADALGGRPLRTATMCSGTESPLLALEMICAACEKIHGRTIALDHAFSCEIEPYKQGYIERNFAPQYLFRDIRELGREKATTAYGRKVKVSSCSRDVDLLIAGTSCTDYSSLNNSKRTIDEEGESGQTWRGLEAWVRKWRPTLVIVENICTASSGKMSASLEQRGYSTRVVKIDTKMHYIPHTRNRK